MRKEVTCGNCPFVMKTPGIVQVIGCKKTDNVVPHRADYEVGIVTFWRVPMDCPRPTSEVAKSETKAKKVRWVEKKIHDIADK